MAGSARDTSIETYRSKRDFTATTEPAPSVGAKGGANAPIFVVQKHLAHRAGLHWDFRLEHNDVLWSWAVRKGPSLDPADKRIAVHVEDHPLDYADFQGSIPEGHYGAGTVATWDRGSWEPLIDPDEGLRDGEIKFLLHGTRLNGKFTLVRLKPRPNQRGRQDNWLLIKGHDAAEKPGADAEALEAAIDFPPASPRGRGRSNAGGSNAGGSKPGGSKPGGPKTGASATPPEAESGSSPPTGKAGGAAPADADAGSAKTASNRRRRSLTIAGAVRGKLPDKPAPQLASVADGPPEEDGWLSEIKFDGYRILASLDHGALPDRQVRLFTRNGNDWTDRLPAVAKAIGELYVDQALVDGELVALDEDGISSFPALQAALSNGRDQTLVYYLFDLLHLDGWDLRKSALRDRKQRLRGLDTWHGMLRYSDHHEGDAARMRQAACKMKLEGIICKKADAPYRPGRGHDWLKVKCAGREELLILGWTEPAGSRTGLGSLHLGYYDPAGHLHYAGGVGSGFSDDVLATLRDRLDGLGSPPPRGLMVAGEDLERTIHWVKPELVAETSFTAWSGSGRVRHAVFLGLREDKPPQDVVRDPADPAAERRALDPKDYAGSARRKGPIIAVPPKRSATSRSATPSAANRSGISRSAGSRSASSPSPSSPSPSSPSPSSPSPSGPAPARAAAARTSSAIVTAKAPKARNEVIEGVTLTHPDRELWPGISKRDLVAYWQNVADHALPGLAKRPLAIVRCPEGIDGEHFFQKHGHGTMPPGVRDGVADKAPYLAIDELQGLVAMAQMSAIELHVWGATEADPLHPDQLVFDLDPGEGVKSADIVAAALDMRDRLEAIGLASFCRTSGGKGLHVVVPLRPDPTWDEVRMFCRGFAEAVSEAKPDKYLAHVKIADRRGRILIDWLRNGLGSTAVASFCPRARPGAGVATPLAWDEVTPGLDLQAFTLRTVPQRLAKLRADPWEAFEQQRRSLPEAPKQAVKAVKPTPRPAGKATIVTAKAPKPRTKRSNGAPG
jgi:bifunctional non-homologous end joining protein LigD